MKSLIAFLRVAVHEMGSWCHASTVLDLKTIEHRVEHEGMSFLTITLPSFGKDLQKGLDRGYVAHDLWTGFRFRGGLPVFLRGFLELVFSPESGVLLDNPSVDAIKALHQITSMFAKVALPCSDERVRAAIDRYVECEQEVRTSDSRRSEVLNSEFHDVGRVLFSEIFTRIDMKVYEGELIPKHGPGATADRLRANAKYNQLEWTTRLDKYFPFGEFVLPNWRYWSVLDEVSFLEPGDERPVRVITVPKTLKTPRIIAVEPTCMQYTQQALLEMIVSEIEGDDFLSPLIGFADQIPNRELAREGSITRDLATLDLSEASDRVSNQLVRLLLRNHSNMAGAVDACRSRKADVPGHGVIRLAKFASMGSALCFPFEAMTFLTVIFLAISRDLNTPVTKSLLRKFSGRVRVYGDDIIVPVEHASSVSSMLEVFGLRVNGGKSFVNGKFRESCGGDYYDGHWITPVRVRELFPQSRKDAAAVVSTVSLRNQLFQAGFDRTVEWLDDLLERILVRFPEVYPTSAVLGRHTWDQPTAESMSSSLQIPLVTGYVVKSKLPVSKLEDWGALTKWFIKRGEDPFDDPDHLLRAGRPVAVDIKLRKASIR